MLKTKINKGIENKFYKLLVVTVGLLLAVFLTSKSWMYDDEPIAQTAFHTDIQGLDQTNLRLNSWEYNPEKLLMEVSITTIHRGSDPIQPSYSFAARERNATEEYPVEIVFYDNDNIVIQIKEVEEDFEVVGLYVREHRDEKILRRERAEQESNLAGNINQDGDRKEEGQEAKPSEKLLVGDYRTIKVNHELDNKDQIQYQIEYVELELTQIERQRSNIKENEIILQNELIEQLNVEISELEAEKEYQVENEKQETDAFIESKNKAIDQAKQEIEKLEKDLEIIDEKEQQLLKKLKNLTGNNKDREEKSEEESKEIDDKEIENE